MEREDSNLHSWGQSPVACRLDDAPKQRAGEGGRTLIIGLEDRNSPVELHPQAKWAPRGSNPLPPVKSRQLYP